MARVACGVLFAPPPAPLTLVLLAIAVRTPNRRRGNVGRDIPGLANARSPRPPRSRPTIHRRAGTVTYWLLGVLRVDVRVPRCGVPHPRCHQGAQTPKAH